MKTFQEFQDKHEGETCIVIGNGPSLADVPRDLLVKYDTFGANRIFVLDDYIPRFYSIIDKHMIHTCGPYIMENWVGEEWPKAPEAMFIRADFPLPGALPLRVVVQAGFTQNPAQAIVMGGTVTYANLQIAYYMGYTKVLLVGVDHFYHITKKYRPGSVFVAEGNDADHFHPDYFQEGSFYAAPEVEGTTLSYEMAKKVFDNNGREIINLTPGSKLEVFEKGVYADYL